MVSIPILVILICSVMWWGMDCWSHWIWMERCLIDMQIHVCTWLIHLTSRWGWNNWWSVPLSTIRWYSFVHLTMMDWTIDWNLWNEWWKEMSCNFGLIEWVGRMITWRSLISEWMIGSNGGGNWWTLCLSVPTVNQDKRNKYDNQEGDCNPSNYDWKWWLSCQKSSIRSSDLWCVCDRYHCWNGRKIMRVGSSCRWKWERSKISDGKKEVRGRRMRKKTNL